MEPQKGLFIFLIMLSALVAFACDGSDAVDGADGDAYTGAGFGQQCVVNTDCESGMCADIAGSASGFCTFACSLDADCRAVNISACCNATAGYCLTGDQCGSVTDGDDGDQLCSPDAYRCLGSDLQRCNLNGDWEFYRDCQANGKTCQNNDCVDVVTDGDELPDGDSSTNDCVPTEKRCVGNVVEICKPNGSSWREYEECGVGMECDQGQCIVKRGDECEVEDGCTANNEYCLPDTPGGDSGYCVVYCDQEGARCPRGWSCEHGQCEPVNGYCTSDAQCEMDQFCDMMTGANDGICRRYCELVGENCPELYSCVKDPSDVNYGRCVLTDPTCIECTYDAECNPGFYCETVGGQTQGCCKPSCSGDEDCPGMLVCSPDGRCVIGSGGGDCGGGCPPAYVCDRTFNQCVLNCPACGEQECCDVDSAPNCYTCICENPVVCGILLPPCCFGYNCSAIVYGVLGYCI